MSTHKTRKEKIIADLRRKLAKQDTPMVSSHYSIKKPVLSYTYSPVSTTTSIDSSHFYPDLKKTLLLTISIIGFELLLYFMY